MTIAAPVPVLYLTGWCRSGTTLIGNLLGELPGVLHVGELRYLWANAVLGTGTNNLCGCGRPLPDCPLWSVVLDRMTGGDPGYAARTVHRQQTWLRTRHATRRLAESLGRRRRPDPAATVLAERARLYATIAGAAGARLIVDGGKFPAEAAALAGTPGIDLRVLHVVRDPRATAESWRRAKAYIPPMGALRSTAYWVGFNLASDRIGRALPDRYLRVRYEDFAAEPHRVLAEMLRLTGLPATGSPVGPDGTAVLGVNHTVTGNPDRLRHGPVQIRADNAWHHTQPRGHRRLATAVAAPLLRRYRYPWSVQPPVPGTPELEVPGSGRTS